MSSLMRVKLWRDIRASWSRFALMVVAITVSLTLFGGILFAWAAVGRETSGAYLGTDPASATIVLEQGVSVDQMRSLAAEVRAWPEVLEATGRTQFNSDVEVDGIPVDIPLQVFVAAPERAASGAARRESKRGATSRCLPRCGCHRRCISAAASGLRSRAFAAPGPSRPAAARALPTTAPSDRDA